MSLPLRPLAGVYEVISSVMSLSSDVWEPSKIMMVDCLPACTARTGRVFRWKELHMQRSVLSTRRAQYHRAGVQDGDTMAGAGSTFGSLEGGDSLCLEDHEEHG